MGKLQWFLLSGCKGCKDLPDAKHFCENEGAYLLTFYPCGLVSVLLWEHGGAVDGYTNWNPSQPSLVAGQRTAAQSTLGLRIANGTQLLAMV
ncbi:hypothetical protein BSL78_02369 [Apostichopus japonicus]|uniref:Uncharacterized protein n=1 Tax=Stichopus japonicus TaxID=307972 RepID=A0A2G8LK91_STIJA|nr:hypothetical protein BSL78_02369 [Apostichopus japonicus]